MDAPAGFKRWKPYWFQCPHCGYRSFDVFGKVEVAKEKTKLTWRLWCAECEGLAVLRNPYFTHGLVLLASVVLFIGTYGLMEMLLGYLAPETPLVWAVSWGLGLGAVVTYFIAPLLTRVCNSFTPI